MWRQLPDPGGDRVEVRYTPVDGAIVKVDGTVTPANGSVVIDVDLADPDGRRFASALGTFAGLLSGLPV